MKKKRHILLPALMLMLGTAALHGQAWNKDSKVLALGIGASDFFHYDNYYYYHYQSFGPTAYTPVTGQLNFQGEFGVHRYVGLGFTTGFGGRGGWNYGYGGEFNIPIGMIANFHFYQLIADRRGGNLYADKLDIYVGANLGTGVAFTSYPAGISRVVPMAFGGLNAGVRYYFTSRVGVNAELGWGKSIVNAGFVFKL